MRYRPIMGECFILLTTRTTPPPSPASPFPHSTYLEGAGRLGEEPLQAVITCPQQDVGAGSTRSESGLPTASTTAATS